VNIKDFVSKNGRLETYEKGEYLLRQGEKGSDIYFIQSGLLKGYYLSREGKEKVKSFISSGDVVGSLRALYEKETNSFSAVCLEDTKAIAVPFELLYRISQSDIEIAKALMDRLISLAIKKEKREFDFLCLSAEERYLQL